MNGTIATFTMPRPIDKRLTVLEYKLWETAYVNATRLIWEAQEAKK